MEELFDDQFFAISDAVQGDGDDIASELAAVLDSERKRADTLTSLRNGLSPMPNGSEWAPPGPGYPTIGNGADGELPEASTRSTAVAGSATARSVGDGDSMAGGVDGAADARSAGAEGADSDRTPAVRSESDLRRCFVALVEQCAKAGASAPMFVSVALRARSVLGRLPPDTLSRLLAEVLLQSGGDWAVSYLQEALLVSLVWPRDVLRAFLRQSPVEQAAAAAAEMCAWIPLVHELLHGYVFTSGDRDECTTLLQMVARLMQVAAAHAEYTSCVAALLSSVRLVTSVRAAGRRAPQAWQALNQVVDAVEDASGSDADQGHARQSLLLAGLMLRRPVACLLCSLEAGGSAFRDSATPWRTLLILLSQEDALGAATMRLVARLWGSAQPSPAVDAALLVEIARSAAQSTASGMDTEADGAREPCVTRVMDLCGALVRALDMGASTVAPADAPTKRRRLAADHGDGAAAATVPAGATEDGLEAAASPSTAEMLRQMPLRLRHDWGGIDRLHRLITRAVPVAARRLDGKATEVAYLALALALISCVVLVVGERKQAPTTANGTDGPDAPEALTVDTADDPLFADTVQALFRLATRLVCGGVAAEWASGPTRTPPVGWRLGVWVIFLMARAPFLLLQFVDEALMREALQAIRLWGRRLATAAAVDGDIHRVPAPPPPAALLTRTSLERIQAAIVDATDMRRTRSTQRPADMQQLSQLLL